jgi:hypothetical protein
MFQLYGYKNGKYQIFETERGVKLDFQGADAEKFEQVNPPRWPTEVVIFSLTLKQLEKFYPGLVDKLTEAQRQKRSNLNNEYQTYAALRDAIYAAIDANPDADPVDALIDTLADIATEDETYASLMRCVIHELMVHSPDEEEQDAEEQGQEQEQEQAEKAEPLLN